MNMTEIESIALFDMDGTLCDHDKALRNSLDKLRSPNEPEIQSYSSLREAPKYIQERVNLIRSPSSWWENLEKFKLGWDILEVAKDLEFNIMIATKGPKRIPEAWSVKKRWIDKHLGQDTEITQTTDKGLVYGKLLVDDWPEYAERWLDWRDRGLVIMPANDFNKNYKYPRVIRYDGTNLDQVKEAMEKVRVRKRGEEINFQL